VLNALRDYYRTSGISEHFRCPLSSNCRSVCTDFISACEAFVGSEYEAGTMPRLLFISLDRPEIYLTEHLRCERSRRCGSGRRKHTGPQTVVPGSRRSATGGRLNTAFGGSRLTSC
jgi:hypothetical protein